MYNIDTKDKKQLIGQVLNAELEFSDSVACLPYVLMCGVPILDFETAWDGLLKLALLGDNSHAAMWMSYIHTNHHPLGLEQENLMTYLLSRNDALLNYSLASFYYYQGKISEAKKWAIRSVELQPFPNSIRLLIRLGIESQLDARNYVKDQNYTLNGTYSGYHLYDSFLGELITGEYVTKEAWDILYN